MFEIYFNQQGSKGFFQPVLFEEIQGF